MKNITKLLFIILSIIFTILIFWYYPYNYQCQKYCNESYANKNSCNTCIHQTIKCESSTLYINYYDICEDEDGYVNNCITYTCKKRG